MLSICFVGKEASGDVPHVISTLSSLNTYLDLKVQACLPVYPFL